MTKNLICGRNFLIGDLRLYFALLSKDSDIDIAVVVDRASGDYLETLATLWRLADEINDEIEPVLLLDTEDTAADLNSTARDLISVRAMIEELEAEAEALTDKIKAAMVAQGTESIQGEGWKATWKNVNSSRFDSKAFKAAHADLYGQYSKATTTTRFVLSV